MNEIPYQKEIEERADVLRTLALDFPSTLIECKRSDDSGYVYMHRREVDPIVWFECARVDSCLDNWVMQRAVLRTNYGGNAKGSLLLEHKSLPGRRRIPERVFTLDFQDLDLLGGWILHPEGRLPCQRLDYEHAYTILNAVLGKEKEIKRSIFLR